ncbi:hypothetical protein Pcinc_038343 [Petrolisthes cinctipes]|uniref:Ig-like domain-containing protein n=1 Tax=Petrolisthes cinctipes TaxID=88211 RepID=A0AAE1BTW0_PETCI|nr:hypothetical protein Pcinc_038343 [Petrolisthes cinctipes]
MMDGGDDVCFYASSRRTHLSLWVVEPPSQPILRVGDRRVMDGVLGPLQEDTALAITCTVAGGVPPPSVEWKRDGEVVDTVVESRQGELTVNELRVLRLSRGFHNAHLSCTAKNNNVTSHVTASVTVTMNPSTRSHSAVIPIPSI